MGRKAKEWRECRTAGDFERAARAKGLVVESRGRHRCIVHKGHAVPLGHSNGELPVGTRGSILRSLAKLGLLLLVLAAIATAVL